MEPEYHTKWKPNYSSLLTSPKFESPILGICLRKKKNRLLPARSVWVKDTIQFFRIQKLVDGTRSNMKTKTTRPKRDERKKTASTTDIIHMHGWILNPIRWSNQRERLEYLKIWNTSSCFYEYWNKRTDGGDKPKRNTTARQKKSKH